MENVSPASRRQHPGTEPGREALAVAVDASLWDEPTTGIGLYTRNLVGALEQEGVRIRRIGARRSGENPRGDTSRTAYFLGKLPRVLADVDEPLFHALCNFNLPPVRVGGKRMVLTVHDLIPELLPETVSVAYRWQFRLWLARSIRIADRIICVSHKTRDDLTSRFDVSKDKLAVIYHGVDHVALVPSPDATAAAFLKSLALPEEYVLYAGAIDARKNIESLIAAMGRIRVRYKPVTLVLVGQDWYGSAAVAGSIGRARREGIDIRLLGYQSAPLFYALMRGATVFVLPSKYEGFGLPPLEAMELGVPAVVSSAGALPEICGEAAVQVPPDDVEGWAAALVNLLKSPSERQARAAVGKRWSAQFTWRDAARQTIDVYRSVLREAN